MDHAPQQPIHRLQHKRPSFHLDVDDSSSEDEEHGAKGPPVQRPVSPQPLPATTNNSTAAIGPVDEAILRFSAESLHSFSYASVSQNSISQRIAVLKQSLKFLKENPLMLKDLQRSLSSVSLASTPQAFAERSTVLKHVLSNIRSSASSVTLSMLNTLSNQNQQQKQQQQQSNVPNVGLGVNVGGPGVDRNGAYRVPSPRIPSRAVSQGEVPTLSNNSQSGTIDSANVDNSFNENLERVLETLETVYSGNDRDDYVFSSPTLDKERSQSEAANTNAPGHVRALTSTSAMTVENQILEALATPYVDVAWRAMMQRSGSVTNVPAMIHSVSTLNLVAAHGMDAPTSAPTITPMSSVTSKSAAKHSIFTTKDDEPFHILSSNDIACLVFGLSQKEMRQRSLLDMIVPDNRDALIEAIKQHRTAAVPLCGALFPIIKSNGHEKVASFWVKYNVGKKVLIWVIEEVLRDLAVVTVDDHDKIIEVAGANFQALVSGDSGGVGVGNSHISDVLPDLNRENVGVNSPQEYQTLRFNEQNLPCFVKSKPRSVEIGSLPHMSGVVILSKQDLTIVDYNRNFLYTLLGYDQPITGRSIDMIIPNFVEYLRVIVDVHQLDAAFGNVGLVIPEHMFRKTAAMSRPSTVGVTKTPGSKTNDNVDDDASDASKRRASSPFPSSDNIKPLYKLPEAPGPNADQDVIDRYSRFISSTGIEARNVQGRSIIVDVQLRVVSPSYFALWLTFTQNAREFRAQTEVPSQLKLFYELQDKRKKRQQEQVAKNEDESMSTDHSRSSSLSQSDSASSSSTPQPNTDNHEPLLTPGTDVSVDIAEYSKHVTEIGAKRRTKKIGDFDICLNMGEGAYGKVLLAQYKKEPRVYVVIKCVIKERILVDTWTRDRKLGTIPNEIKVMHTLNSTPHPNIIRLLDFFEDDDYYHIEMERHGNPGTDLFDLIELRPDMGEIECRSIFQQVVSAIQHLHKHGIVHRDIKDENIVVDEMGKIKLIDFGSSAYVKQGPFDVFVGTIDYAAPEVLAGRPYSGMPQDIWALGILLYTIAYKENPFYNFDEIMDGDLRIKPNAISAPWLDLINLILCRDVDKRPSITTIAEHEWLSSSPN